MKPRIHVIEVVKDKELRARQAQATAVFRRFYPGAPPLRLFRTRDGRLGFQAQVSIAPGQRELSNLAYAQVMRVLGEKRGRSAGERKVQAKLRLRAPVYRA